MDAADEVDATVVLRRAGDGDESAVRQLMVLVYDELRALAQTYLKQERPDHTLQATALVHEAYVRLIRQKDVEWKSRAHFFGVAAQAIRRILVDHARHHGRLKRGGGAQRLTVHEDMPLTGAGDVDLIDLDDALTELAGFDTRAARLVELRFFAGLGREEAAEVLGVSLRTVADDWRLARAWLRRALT